MPEKTVYQCNERKISLIKVWKYTRFMENRQKNYEERNVKLVRSVHADATDEERSLQNP